MNDDGISVWVPVWLALGCVLLLAKACGVDAQGLPGDIDAARCLVAETDSTEPDLTATAYVLVRRGRMYHRTASQEAHRFCGMYVARHPSERQRSIAVLVPDRRTQRGRQLTEALEALADVRRSLRPDPCHGVATSWGDRYEDARRARAAGYIPVDCGATRDAYWIATRRIPLDAGRPPG